jgi:beta-N-acetylhexosaminidase
MRLSSDPAARRRLAVLVGLAGTALVAGMAVGADGGQRGHRSAAEGTPQRLRVVVDRLSLRQQVGQLTISAFPDRTVPAYVRRRLRSQETAGVILFAGNADTPAEWRRLTRSLQRAASNRALVLVDQEGGDVRTVRWAGPGAPQPLQGSPAEVRRAAEGAARQLRRAGVNVDLAPVADVPGGAAPVVGFRAFAGDVRGIAARTRASIAGMWSARVAAAAKHFPGLGRSHVNTDDGSAVVRGDLRGDLVPFRAAIAQDVPLVMLSHALYPALDTRHIASQSRHVVTALLRRRLGFRGVIVTDSIEAQAVLDRSGVAAAAERSIAAGADHVQMTGRASWYDIYPRLLARARRSKSFRQRVRQAAIRVLALKARLGLRGAG